ncbi:MAG: DNA-protecting protein DprA [Candidatus Doudnabacteria bacterium]|nr:DNA-protecting protein DprA [Candidatus Doudnabacteria bacterium]
MTSIPAVKDELREFTVSLSLCKGVGALSFRRIMEEFNGIEGVHAAYEEGRLAQLGELSIPDWSQLHEQEYLCIWEEDYPPSLAAIPDAPPVLYYKGNRQVLKRKQVAVVGSRKVNTYGEKVTRLYTKSLVDNGYAVVSGLAFGVDTLAHEECIRNGGATVAVLPCDLRSNPLAGNGRLAEDVIRSGGILVSEQFPGKLFHKGMFAMRNRIIAGLGEFTLITMAGSKSGAAITAKCAFDYGREVYAIPAGIDQDLSKGCNNLIRDGVAALSLSPNDILPNFSYERAAEGQQLHLVDREVLANLSDAAQNLYKQIQNSPINLDEVVVRFDRSLPDALSLLTELTISGLIEQTENGQYTCI